MYPVFINLNIKFKLIYLYFVSILDDIKEYLDNYKTESDK